MQQALDADHPDLDIEIIGVNDVGFEAGNEAFCEGRDLPWLQNTPELDVWAAWGGGYRDVLILDADNVPVAVYNLTSNSLATPENFEALQQLFVDVALGLR